MTKEQWVDAYSFSGWGEHYQVSSLGRVRSWKNARHGKRKIPRILSGSVNPNGYRSVFLSKRGSNKIKGIYVHRLVAFSFMGPPKPGQECCHLNGKPSDNRLINVAWVSKSENESHKEAHRTRIKGVFHKNSKLNPSIVRLIRLFFLDRKPTQHEIASAAGVTRGCIYKIINNQTWSDVF